MEDRLLLEVWTQDDELVGQVELGTVGLAMLRPSSITSAPGILVIVAY